MCGIVGIFEYGRSVGSVTSATVVRMRDTLHHRGPDGEGLYINDDERVGLGHRRLAIVDIAHGAQPMHGRHGDVLVFNGEIYNYPELRRELESDGMPFLTNCDTEVILRLYEREGEACVERLNGMFAFAIWDPERQSLFMARDRIGEKPLYWTARGGRLLFGSEIKALLAHPHLSPEVNEAALHDYLTHLVTIAPATLYRDIYKLPPATIAVCDRNGMRIRRYWSLFEQRSWSNDPPSREQCTRDVRARLTQSVDSRLMSDVPVGVLLSGGLDSTTVVALLRERLPGVATFSVGFEGQPRLDERAEARRVAQHFGTNHHEVVLSESGAVEQLEQLVHHQDEPLADPVCLPLHAVCRLAIDNGVKVVLTGEGSDELFWGYPRYADTLARWRLIRSVLALPPRLRALLPRVFPARISPLRHEFLTGLASGRPLPAHMPLGIASFYRDQLLSGPPPHASGWLPSDGGLASGPRDALQRLAFDTQEYEFGLRLPELLLMRIDRFSMANGVEARVPFLDPRLVEAVYSMPLSYKLAGDSTKLILKEAVEDIVPPWVISRAKRGFGAPVSNWMGSRLGDVFRELLRDPELRRFFNVPLIAQQLERARRGRADFSLWPIMNFALWHRYWIEGRPIHTAELNAVAAS